jgi:hypothetical protein
MSNFDHKRILVCGGRDYINKSKVFQVLNLYTSVQVIIHGAARGADLLAREWAVIHNVPELAFKADWDRYGLGAGPRRNAQMLAEGHPDLVIAFPGGRGTADMIKKARKAGILVIQIGE